MSDPLFTPMPVTVPNQNPPPESFKFGMPFYYDAVSFLWNYFRVPVDVLEPHLKDTGLTPATFPDQDNQAIVSLNFQNYLSNLGTMLATVLEVEFNIHCYPTSKADQTPQNITFRDYLQGQEQTKWIGGFRLHVPADDETAVLAGTHVFGERKFLTQFAYSVPVPNHPVTKENGNLEWPWSHTVFDPAWSASKDFNPQAADAVKIYTHRANLDGLGRPVLTNPSPLTLYSLLPGGADTPPGTGRLNASRWNIFGLDKTWFNTDDAKIEVEVGTSPHAMARDIQQVILDTGARSCAIRYFQSPPAAVENRAFWVDEQ